MMIKLIFSFFFFLLIINQAHSNSEKLSLKICNIPNHSIDEKVVLISAIKGASLSTSFLGNGSPIATVIDLEIEEGLEQLYIVAVSTSQVIWRVNGAVDRISNFVAQPGYLTSHDSGVGIVGVERSKITFARSSACISSSRFLRAFDESSYKKTRIFEKTKRLPDIHVRGGTIAKIAVPSGRNITESHILEALHYKSSTDDEIANFIPKKPLNIDDRLWVNFRSKFPAGITQMEPDEIISLAPAQKHSVLPSIAGLIELIKSGAIVQEHIFDCKIVLRTTLEELPARLEGFEVLIESTMSPPLKIPKRAHSELDLDGKPIVLTDRQGNKKSTFKWKSSKYKSQHTRKIECLK